MIPVRCAPRSGLRAANPTANRMGMIVVTLRMTVRGNRNHAGDAGLDLSWVLGSSRPPEDRPAQYMSSASQPSTST